MLARFINNFKAPSLVAFLVAVVFFSRLVDGAQLSVSTDHDMTKPTFGLHGQFGSQITYDQNNGLNLKGTINDFLGPPIKIANGFGNMLAGSGMAGAGNSLKMDGAMLGVDAKLLEAAGGANLLKGGLLMGGAAAKTGLATAMKGFPGKKISSIIEVPVKVVAVKDLAVGKGLTEMGKVKGMEADAAKTRGATMVSQGEALKTQGMNQVIQGATEGLQNIGNMVQQTAGNAATAFKILPIMLDLPTSQQPQQQQVEQQHAESSQHQLRQGNQLSGGSLFGGLGSLLPGLNGANDPFASLLNGAGGAGQTRTPFNLFGQNGHHGYAAILNNTHPLANLLMNPNLNPFLLPLNGLAGGPLGQSITGKQPASIMVGQQPGFNSLLGGHNSGSSYNLFPGLKVTESTSAHSPIVQQQQQQQIVTAPKV